MRRGRTAAVVRAAALAVLLTVGLPVSAAGAAPGPADDADGLPGSEIVAVDQQSRSVLVLDRRHTLRLEEGGRLEQSDRPDEVRWSWSADRAPGLADLHPASIWWGASEAKSRLLHGHRYLLTASSGGLAAVVSYPGAQVYWAAALGAANPHSLELLPDGNVAVTASGGGWLRLYPASQGPRADRYAEVPLAGAHGVHYDPAHALLWAIGNRELTAYKVTGTQSAPALVRVRSTPLPEADGHDLTPVYSPPGRLWVATGAHVWQYDPERDAFARVHLGGGHDDGHDDGWNVKSVGDDPLTGRILTTTPEPGGPCVWCTSVLTLYRPDGTRVLTGTQLYKARWWTTRRW
ncbi:hypothetical protein GCM10009760_46480 [Kitasatospora kazusensis]|uniref:WD40 repeat domain-containing protein n=1 Tax=Kitasatospora kazusensis TaxID=407974 RepID=A0ABP5LSX1_9ACTN